MATTNLPEKKIEDESFCPKCRSSKLLYIEGSLTRWATCPNCKFKKLVAKTDTRTVRVTPLLKQDF
ncbi:MAG: hypothetical protein QW751_02565 [Candidatus Aenigmatarchaeota archaeon]|nr:hypothetical protein [Candidatus Aenigmarchaeota archaeon]